MLDVWLKWLVLLTMVNHAATVTSEQKTNWECKQGESVVQRCKARANEVVQGEQNMHDVKFFESCIVQLYCFETRGTMLVAAPVIPRMLSKNQEKLFNKIGQRVERFFLRNNYWTTLIKTPQFAASHDGRRCNNLLTVTAARFFYAMYVFRKLTRDFTFEKCVVKGNAQRGTEHGACFIWPRVMKCGDQLEFKMLGSRSGTVTSLFDQYFRQQAGRDKTVPGFGSTSEEVMGVRILAYKVDYAMPLRYPTGVSQHSQYKDYMLEMSRQDQRIQLLGITIATYKIRRYNQRYYNELISAANIMKNAPELYHISRAWAVEVHHFEDNVESFQKGAKFAAGINFKRRQNINYELILGSLENANISDPISLTEDALVLLQHADTYITPGTIRHVIGDLEMNIYQNKRHDYGTINIEDYWMSMLENWADAYRIYTEQCRAKKWYTKKCLVQMSPNLYRMTNAMYLMGGILGTDKDGDKRLKNIVQAELTFQYLGREYLGREGSQPYYTSDKYKNYQARDEIMNSTVANKRYMFGKFKGRVPLQTLTDRQMRLLGKIRRKAENLAKNIGGKLTFKVKKWKKWKAKMAVKKLKNTRPVIPLLPIDNAVGKLMKFFRCPNNSEEEYQRAQLSYECMGKMHEVVKKYNTKFYMKHAERYVKKLAKNP